MSRIRRICLLLALLVAGTGLWAETVFSIAPVMTWSYADIREYVYIYPSYIKLSELDWDVHNVIQYGVRSDFIRNRFYAYAEASVAVQDECGYMQDYDWMFAYSSVPNPNHYPVSQYTEFSEHPVSLLEKNSFDLHTGWEVYDSRKLTLALGGGFQFIRTTLESHDGYSQYSPDRNNPEPYSSSRPKNTDQFSGPGIDYRLDIESLWIDVRLSFSPSKKFDLIAEGGISPWQILRQDDIHLLRNLWFYDNPVSSIMYRGLLSADFNVNKRGSIVLTGSVLSLPYADGNSYTHTSQTDLALSAGQLGGTGYLGWDVSLSYRIRIF